MEGHGVRVVAAPLMTNHKINHMIVVKGSLRDFVLHHSALFGYFPYGPRLLRELRAPSHSPLDSGNCAPGAFAISLGIAWLSRQAVAWRVCPPLSRRMAPARGVGQVALSRLRFSLPPAWARAPSHSPMVLAIAHRALSPFPSEFAWPSLQAVACGVCLPSHAGWHLCVEWGRWL